MPQTQTITNEMIWNLLLRIQAEVQDLARMQRQDTVAEQETGYGGETAEAGEKSRTFMNSPEVKAWLEGGWEEPGGECPICKHSNYEPKGAPPEPGKIHAFTTLEDARKWYAAADNNDALSFKNTDSMWAWLNDDEE
jgi:hypothetical protein